MRKSIIALAVAGSVAVGGAALAGPALAGTTAPSATGSSSAPASSSSASDAADTDRPSPQARIGEALGGLVTDGTITQAQSDAVATTLAEQVPQGRGGHGGPGGHGRHGGAGGAGQIATAAAEALGLDEADLRAELQDGRSVADVAEEEGVDLDTVVAAVTDAATARISQAVTDGKMTQEQADELTAGLADRIAEEVDEVHDGGRGPGGRGGHGPDASGSSPAPAQAPAS